MKIIGIGDKLIPSEYIKQGFQSVWKKPIDLTVYDWPIESYEELQKINLEIEKSGPEQYLVDSDFLNKLQQAEILITQFFPINKQVIDACPNLKIIGVLRAGMENINLDYAQNKNIKVINTAGRNANAVADFTVGILISECRNIARSHSNLKQAKWVRDYSNANDVPDLEGRTASIIGFGEIGQKVAQRLHGFGVKILSYDPFQKSFPNYVTSVTFEEALRQADFVCLHARLTKENYHLINRNNLSLLKSTAYIINTARSGLIDQEALVEHLKQHKIAGAALDVFDQEPIASNDPILTLDNLTITPHLAGGTTDAFKKSPVLLANKILSI